MTQIVQIHDPDWALTSASAAQRAAWVERLENGDVLHFTQLPFTLNVAESELVDPRLVPPQRKTISLDASGDTKRGVLGDKTVQSKVHQLMMRFRAQTIELVNALAPGYGTGLQSTGTELRFLTIPGSMPVKRKDETLLHVDAMPSRPNNGARILRIYCNVNPTGQPWMWRVGEPFEAMARHMLRHVKPYRAWQAQILYRLWLTKSLRTEYDHTMVQLHDAMKTDLEYQQVCPQQRVDFAAGGTWMCFTDQASHAYVGEEVTLEQTMHLSLDAMQEPLRAPVRVLERLVGYPLTKL